MSEQGICVGGCYTQDGSVLHIIAMRDEYALLEYKSRNTVVQYIVTSGLFLEENGKLHWRGSGRYFPCMFPPPICDMPYVALCKAMDYIRGPQKVYVVVADTDYGTSADVQPSMAAAKAALQKLLDGNDDIQYTANTCGIKNLSADAYLDGVLTDAPGVLDRYGITEQEVDFSRGGVA